MSASHRLVGFPLHFAYSDTDAIAEGVRGTGVHLCRYSHLFSFDKTYFLFLAGSQELSLHSQCRFINYNLDCVAVWEKISWFNLFCFGQVEPYPGTAMSVWVYVASLVRRR